ncbi:probable prolyl 4-hydroxylase 6 [Phragmites australis]|uniref:probable prolyl 4-hydroxylase 6 n=1 Tax=Phragmites australis TaxID=29695 RepID=UPI002D78804C|nr:probable prolyl 4-hydroxylase 6 [Phragmites australis]
MPWPPTGDRASEPNPTHVRFPRQPKTPAPTQEKPTGKRTPVKARASVYLRAGPKKAKSSRSRMPASDRRTRMHGCTTASLIAMKLRGVLLVLAATGVVAVLLLTADDDDAGAVAPAPPFNSSRVKAVSWQPRIFVYKGFLSDAECDHLVKLGKKKVQRSMVADNASGKSVMSTVRTSSGMFLDKRQDPVISRIEQRIAAWTFLPEENAENIQILRYEHGQKYDPHFDYFHDKVNQARGGHRYATVLMYLSTVEKGGETVFPNAKGWESQPKDDTFSECAQKGLAVKPVKGDAVLFFSLHVNGVPDPLSLHGSCPVIEGEKWSAPKWIHIRSYEHQPILDGTEGCSDKNENCAQWAAAGECAKNQVYMVGGEGSPGQCRKSCKVCDS